jgi:putative transcriptional regulator
MDLRKLRKKVNLRIIDVAYRRDIAEGSVRNWEKGRSIIRLPIDKVALLCSLYQCSVQELSQAMQQSRVEAVEQLVGSAVEDTMAEE